MFSSSFPVVKIHIGCSFLFYLASFIIVIFCYAKVIVVVRRRVKRHRQNAIRRRHVAGIPDFLRAVTDFEHDGAYKQKGKGRIRKKRKLSLFSMRSPRRLSVISPWGKARLSLPNESSPFPQKTMPLDEQTKKATRESLTESKKFLDHALSRTSTASATPNKGMAGMQTSNKDLPTSSMASRTSINENNHIADIGQEGDLRSTSPRHKQWLKKHCLGASGEIETALITGGSMTSSDVCWQKLASIDHTDNLDHYKLGFNMIDLKRECGEGEEHPLDLTPSCTSSRRHSRKSMKKVSDSESYTESWTQKHCDLWQRAFQALRQQDPNQFLDPDDDPECYAYLLDLEDEASQIEFGGDVVKITDNRHYQSQYLTNSTNCDREIANKSSGKKRNKSRTSSHRESRKSGDVIKSKSNSKKQSKRGSCKDNAKENKESTHFPDDPETLPLLTRTNDDVELIASELTAKIKHVIEERSIDCDLPKRRLSKPEPKSPGANNDSIYNSPCSYSDFQHHRIHSSSSRGRESEMGNDDKNPFFRKSKIYVTTTLDQYVNQSCEINPGYVKELSELPGSLTFRKNSKTSSSLSNASSSPFTTRENAKYEISTSIEEENNKQDSRRAGASINSLDKCKTDRSSIKITSEKDENNTHPPSIPFPEQNNKRFLGSCSNLFRIMHADDYDLSWNHKRFNENQVESKQHRKDCRWGFATTSANTPASQSEELITPNQMIATVFDFPSGSIDNGPNSEASRHRSPITDKCLGCDDQNSDTTNTKNIDLSSTILCKTCAGEMPIKAENNFKSELLIDLFGSTEFVMHNRRNSLISMLYHNHSGYENYVNVFNAILIPRIFESLYPYFSQHEKHIRFHHDSFGIDEQANLYLERNHIYSRFNRGATYLLARALINEKMKSKQLIGYFFTLHCQHSLNHVCKQGLNSSRPAVIDDRDIIGNYLEGLVYYQISHQFTTFYTCNQGTGLLKGSQRKSPLIDFCLASLPHFHPSQEQLSAPLVDDYLVNELYIYGGSIDEERWSPAINDFPSTSCPFEVQQKYVYLTHCQLSRAGIVAVDIEKAGDSDSDDSCFCCCGNNHCHYQHHRYCPTHPQLSEHGERDREMDQNKWTIVKSISNPTPLTSAPTHTPTDSHIEHLNAHSHSSSYNVTNQTESHNETLNFFSRPRTLLSNTFPKSETGTDFIKCANAPTYSNSSSNRNSLLSGKASKLSPFLSNLSNEEDDVLIEKESSSTSSCACMPNQANSILYFQCYACHRWCIVTTNKSIENVDIELLKKSRQALISTIIVENIRHSMLESPSNYTGEALPVQSHPNIDSKKHELTDVIESLNALFGKIKLWCVDSSDLKMCYIYRRIVYSETESKVNYNSLGIFIGNHQLQHEQKQKHPSGIKQEKCHYQEPQQHKQHRQQKQDELKIVHDKGEVRPYHPVPNHRSREKISSTIKEISPVEHHTFEGSAEVRFQNIVDRQISYSNYSDTDSSVTKLGVGEVESLEYSNVSIPGTLNEESELNSSDTSSKSSSIIATSDIGVGCRNSTGIISIRVSDELNKKEAACNGSEISPTRVSSFVIGGGDLYISTKKIEHFSQNKSTQHTHGPEMKPVTNIPMQHFAQENLKSTKSSSSNHTPSNNSATKTTSFLDPYSGHNALAPLSLKGRRHSSAEAPGLRAYQHHQSWSPSETSASFKTMSTIDIPTMNPIHSTLMACIPSIKIGGCTSNTKSLEAPPGTETCQIIAKSVLAAFCSSSRQSSAASDPCLNLDEGDEFDLIKIQPPSTEQILEAVKLEAAKLERLRESPDSSLQNNNRTVSISRAGQGANLKATESSNLGHLVQTADNMLGSYPPVRRHSTFQTYCKTIGRFGRLARRANGRITHSWYSVDDLSDSAPKSIHHIHVSNRLSQLKMQINEALSLKNIRRVFSLNPFRSQVDKHNDVEGAPSVMCRHIDVVITRCESLVMDQSQEHIGRNLNGKLESRMVMPLSL